MRILWFCSSVAFLVVVLSVVITATNTSISPPVSYQRFTEILKQHDVEKVISYRSGDLFIAEVFLKNDALTKQEYSDARREKSEYKFSDRSVPQYVFTSATFDALFKQITDEETAWGWTESERIPVTLEAGHESLLSNWLVQCIIMLIMLMIPVLCGYIGFNEGKSRSIGSTAGIWLGVLLGPFGLIFVFVSQKTPPKGSGGIRV